MCNKIVIQNKNMYKHNHKLNHRLINYISSINIERYIHFLSLPSPRIFFFRLKKKLKQLNNIGFKNKCSRFRKKKKNLMFSKQTFLLTTFELIWRGTRIVRTSLSMFEQNR